MLRTIWQSVFKYNSLFGLVLILLFGIPRFIIVLSTNITGNYQFVPIIFILMTLAPFIFLTKRGRMFIGIKKPANYYWLFYAFIIGIAFCTISFFITNWLYASSMSNSFVYISRSYAVSKTGINDSNRLVYFLIYAIISMTFSPIGEELFYRGLVHGSFAGKLGEAKASVIDSLAFAFTHLAHFGIVYISGTWHFLFVPAVLWTCFMFLASRCFFISKQNSGSIWGAVVCHAGFNLAMMYFIFYRIF